MPSPITNCYDPSEARPKLAGERVRIYAPEQDWTYSHHQSIAFFQGRFHAVWSNHRCNEDHPGQRVLWSSAAEFQHWDEPRPLFDSRAGDHSEVVLTAAGFHPHGGTLVAYAGQYEYSREALATPRLTTAFNHQNDRLLARTTTDGRTWGPERDLALPIVPNHGPQPTASGRLIISGNISFPHSDDPSGLAGWRMAGIYPPDWPARDDSEAFWIVQKLQGWRTGLCEGSFYQTGDGVIHMLLRSMEKRLWLTESRDDGATWSAPEPLEWSDCGSKFHFGRLPDGRFYCVSCPDRNDRRDPLVLQVSADGVRFDRHFILADEPYEMKRAGMHKGGLYGYPHTLLHGDYLYVIYSLRKEAVEVLRMPWKEIPC